MFFLETGQSQTYNILRDDKYSSINCRGSAGLNSEGIQTCTPPTELILTNIIPRDLVGYMLSPHLLDRSPEKVEKEQFDSCEIVFEEKLV